MNIDKNCTDFARMNKKILIIGGTGLLALNWALTVRNQFEIILALHDREISLNGTRSIKVDTSSYERISEALDQIRPDIVINTAGLTSVELCEKFPQRATEINTTLAINLAKSCLTRQIKFIHISTDHLFSGESSLVAEIEPPKPKNVYGITKANAELGIVNVNSEALIIRTNFYAWGPGYRASFSDTIINSLRSGRTLNLFTDVFYTPILAKTLIDIVHQLMERNASGIFNVVSDQRISKYDFGLKLAKEFNLDNDLINEGKIIDKPSLVNRPHDMSLSNQKVSNYLGRKMGGLDEHILKLKTQEVNGLAQELQAL